MKTVNQRMILWKMSTINDSNIAFETLVNHSSYMKNKPLEKQPTENKKSTTLKPVKIASKRTNADYSITEDDRYAAVVGRELGIEERTAQRWWGSYEETGEVPIKKLTRNPGHSNNFTEEHKTHVLDLVDDDPQVTVCDVVESRTKSSEDFSLTKSIIHKHMNETYNLSVKKPHFESEKRNSLENLQERYERFMKWKDSDADFTKNCIFIDESGFRINMRKNYAWSRKSDYVRVRLYSACPDSYSKRNILLLCNPYWLTAKQDK
ncbi:hypothetical protein BCV72DRAFT_304819 [Rhizopus microsporus var. microsporus]|uniref:Uncharacterized protein n=2 Tax=Rhizopus microsporus TaxID=58291 RepID=A0A2G4SMH2_RHIZD|nr:uncharacterized protein RHIMIDRAFT_293941 [Rhizopus microsporus ATCC 52813]ORE07192.1 hypothetical protein BCV72DRAFT_304819 [Rhizopus microsporus var. microsporus]PHZ09981.1 hypothetical protein RHIMIDRAFT_293941 [Rhizopus microsporus ATCC 52813]